MRQGLSTPQERAAAEKWVDDNVDKALRDLQHPPTATNYASLDKLNEALADVKSNVFYNKVVEIENFAKAKANGDTKVYSDTLSSGVSKLKQDSIKALDDGVKPESVMDVFKKAFQSFDIWHPVDSITEVLKAALQGVVMLVGGDMAAPFIESFKKGITKEQAAQNLDFQNGAQNLTSVLGIQDSKDFDESIAKQLDAVHVPDGTTVAPLATATTPRPATAVIRPA